MKMHRENKKPVMVILSGFFASETAVYEEEKRLIAKYQNLTNATKGGEGLSGHVFSAEHKNKISKALKKRVRSPEHGANISKAKLGSKMSLGSIEKTRRGNTGKKRTPEQRKAISVRKKLWWAETIFDNLTKTCMTRKEQFGCRQKHNKYGTGRKLTEEHKQKISEANKASWKKRKQENK